MSVICLDESPPRAAKPTQPTGAELRQMAANFLKGRDLQSISIKELRRGMETQLSLPEGSLTSRKDEIKAIAVEFVSAANKEPTPAEKTQVPVAVDPGSKRSAPEAALGAEPVKKAKRSPSAYQLFSSARGAVATEELQKSLQTKPSFGQVASKISEMWKNLPVDEKKKFEDDAAKAKAEAATATQSVQPSDTSGSKRGRGEGRGQGNKEPKQGRGRGGGKGRGKSSQTEEGVMTRAEFIQKPVTLKCRIEGLSMLVAEAEEDARDNEAESGKPFELQSSSRVFKSGSVGWFQGGKGVVDVDGKKVVVQVGLNITAVGSKNWQDGEGFETLRQQVVDPDEKAQLEDVEVPRSSSAPTDVDSGVSKADLGSVSVKAVENTPTAVENAEALGETNIEKTTSNGKSSLEEDTGNIDTASAMDVGDDAPPPNLPSAAEPTDTPAVALNVQADPESVQAEVESKALTADTSAVALNVQAVPESVQAEVESKAPNAESSTGDGNTNEADLQASTNDIAETLAQSGA